MSDDDFMQLGNGVHKVRIDGDLVIMRSLGVTTLADFEALRSICDRVKREHGSLYVMYDSRQGQGVDRETRKRLMQPTPDEVRPNAAVAFGAKFSSRILINMIDRALAAFGKTPSGVAMVETEEEARAHIQRHRRKSSRLSRP